MTTRDARVLPSRWRWPFVCLIALLGLNVDGATQSSLRGLAHDLEALFPAATRFGRKSGTPPHIRAFRGEGGAERLIGFAFSTIDLEPLERGYEGPIEMLVGLDTAGRITGVKVIAHREPYGYFSIDPPAFTEQFKGKSVLDRFRIGADIDAVTGASITVSSATRAIRKSARRIARQFLAGGGGRP